MAHTVRPGASAQIRQTWRISLTSDSDQSSDRLHEPADSPIPVGVTSSVHTAVAERLRALRKERKLTQQQVAEGADVPYESYAGYERNEERAPLERVDNLARFFRVSIDYLVGATNERKQP